MRGKPHPDKPDDTAHFWIEKGDKKIDVTGYGIFSSGKKVDAVKNIDEVIKDKLFKTLSKKDKDKIMEIKNEKSKSKFKDNTKKHLRGNS